MPPTKEDQGYILKWPPAFLENEYNPWNLVVFAVHYNSGADGDGQHGASSEERTPHRTDTSLVSKATERWNFDEECITTRLPSQKWYMRKARKMAASLGVVGGAFLLDAAVSAESSEDFVAYLNCRKVFSKRTSRNLEGITLLFWQKMREDPEKFIHLYYIGKKPSEKEDERVIGVMSSIVRADRIEELQIRRGNNTGSAGIYAANGWGIGSFFGRQKRMEVASTTSGIFGYNLRCFWTRYKEEEKSLSASRGIPLVPELYLDQIKDILEQSHRAVFFSWPGNEDSGGIFVRLQEVPPPTQAAQPTRKSAWDWQYRAMLIGAFAVLLGLYFNLQLQQKQQNEEMHHLIECMSKVLWRRHACIRNLQRVDNTGTVGFESSMPHSGVFPNLSMHSYTFYVIAIAVIFTTFNCGLECNDFWRMLWSRPAVPSPRNEILESIQNDLDTDGYAMVATRSNILLDPKFRRFVQMEKVLYEERKIEIHHVDKKTVWQEIENLQRQAKTSGSPSSKDSNGSSETAQDTVVMNSPSDD